MNMKLLFTLDYRTAWGQDLCVEITITRNNGVRKTGRHKLYTQDGWHWNGEATITDRDARTFSYRYMVCTGDSVIRREWNGVRRTFPYDIRRTLILKDFWKDIPRQSHLYSSAYCHCVHMDMTAQPDFTYFDHTLLFRVQAPQLRQGQCLALIGSLPQLGQWTPERALVMQRGGIHEWCLTLSAAGLHFPFQYKYVVMDEKTGEFLEWEEGENRMSPDAVPGSVQVIWDEELRLKEDHWKAAGVVAPVFSMRSRHSQGCGDFGDLRLMVDWAVKTGMSVIQVLPIYDTTQTATWTDCYPYNAISIYALHPIYLDLSQLPEITDDGFMHEYQAERKRINALQQMDYEATYRLKMKYLHRLYAQEGDAVTESQRFGTFMDDNADWITDYAVFCHRRDAEKTTDFDRWHALSTYRSKDVHDYAANNRKEVSFYCYVQYLLDMQLSATTRYARQNGVILKGDIPIGISRTSVEAWKEPQYFNMDGSAGAPPDDFSADGQNWGFPTYNWDRMAQDGYCWWINRLRRMARYFDAYRIDHVLGFFRIWEIPTSEKSGLMGHFSPQMPLTIGEIERMGLPWRPDLYTKPNVSENVLRQLLGNDENEIQEILHHKDEDRLFISMPQPDGTNRYVPRICANRTFAYRLLTDNDRKAFDRIYEDFYFHRHNDFWAAEAMKRLPALVEATDMLCCAEDLGMVPSCVGPVMQALGILSLEIQAMPKEYGIRFARLENNPYRSVATIFTHDMPTMRQWWEEDAERSQEYYNQVLQIDGRAPKEMPGWLCGEVIARHLFSPSMLCLISLQDWLSMDEELRAKDPAAERINIPADPHHYWRYRMHMNIEDLTDAEGFNGRIREMTARSAR